MKRIIAACVITVIILAAACERSPLDYQVANNVASLFLLNEGQEGSNDCTLDYYDYSTGIYSKNIFPDCNPEVIDELGSVGTDIAIYGSRIWVVVNRSNLVEVIDVRDGITPGTVYCFSGDGRLKWKSYTGVKPSRFVFSTLSLL